MKHAALLPTTGPWPGLARLIERAESFDDLVAHRVGPLAADHLTALGRRNAPSDAYDDVRRIAHVYASRRTLRAIVDALDDEVVLFKGLAVAARYPRPELRAYGDLDILVRNPARAQRRLLEVGFQPVGPHGPEHFEGLQHLQPLAHPDHGYVPVEIHAHASWVSWSAPPSAADMIDVAIPSGVGVDGVLEPDPAHHALVVAAHSAGDMPLRCVGDLLDIDLLSRDADPERQRRAAEAWGLDRLWTLYRQAADAVLYDAHTPMAMRVWAPSLRRGAEGTVFERHLRNWLSPIWTRAPRDAACGVAAALFNDLRPADGETWSEKAVRLRRGGRNLRTPLGEHTLSLGDAAMRPRHRRRTTDERAKSPQD